MVNFTKSLVYIASLETEIGANNLHLEYALKHITTKEFSNAKSKFDKDIAK